MHIYGQTTGAGGSTGCCVFDCAEWLSNDDNYGGTTHSSLEET